VKAQRTIRHSDNILYE